MFKKPERETHNYAYRRNRCWQKRLKFFLEKHQLDETKYFLELVGEAREKRAYVLLRSKRDSFLRKQQATKKYVMRFIR